MIHPSYSELMKVVNSDVEPGNVPVVASRYSIVMAASKRARQIIDEDKVENRRPDEMTREKKEVKKPLSIAVKELYQGAVRIMGDENEEEEE